MFELRCEGIPDPANATLQLMEPSDWTFDDILVEPQEGQIIRVASPSSDFNLVVELLGGDLLYVDQGAHTPLVIIKRGKGLFGWES